MLERSFLSSISVIFDEQRRRYMLTLTRDKERVTLNASYLTYEEAKRVGNTMLSEWSRTGRKPTG